MNTGLEVHQKLEGRPVDDIRVVRAAHALWSSGSRLRVLDLLLRPDENEAEDHDPEGDTQDGAHKFVRSQFHPRLQSEHPEQSQGDDRQIASAVSVEEEYEADQKDHHAGDELSNRKIGARHYEPLS